MKENGTFWHHSFIVYYSKSYYYVVAYNINSKVIHLFILYTFWSKINDITFFFFSLIK